MEDQSAPILKYRPVLTAEQILHAITLAKRDASPKSLDLASALALYEFKIRERIISPAYQFTPPVSLEKSLGFEDSNNAGKTDDPKDVSILCDESLYQQWLRSPESLSVSQLELIRQWRYNNNKMTDEEEKRFEKEVLGIDTGAPSLSI